MRVGGKRVAAVAAVDHGAPVVRPMRPPPGTARPCTLRAVHVLAQRLRRVSRGCARTVRVVPGLCPRGSRTAHAEMVRQIQAVSYGLRSSLRVLVKCRDDT